MNDIKAVIVEIHKDYSIVLTQDGQFLKQHIPAGSYEIGDNIFVSDSNQVEGIKENYSAYRLISRIAVGFTACALIVAGSYFGIHFFRQGRGPAIIAVAQSSEDKSSQAPQQEKADDLQAGLDEEPEIMLSNETPMMKESSNEGDFNEGEDNLTEGSQEDTSGLEAVAITVLYEGNHDIGKINADFSINYQDIKIDYRIEENNDASDDNQDKKSILFNFIQNKRDYFFNGNIDTILNDVNQSALRTVTLLFENFEYGQQRTEAVELENEEKSFKLVIYGSFN